jgi:AraC-like DNA-binding protein
MRFRICNVRSLYRPGSLKTVAREFGKYKFNLAGVQVRWEALNRQRIINSYMEQRIKIVT